MISDRTPLNIVIVGGGTAGWLSAGLLSTQLPQTTNRPVQVTLIEASDIPTIGVGEATIPSLRSTLAACDISEAEFLQNCDATFKHGIEFVQWRRTEQADPGEAYFHPFGDPLQVNGQNAARQWSRLDNRQRGAYGDLFSVQPEMARAGRAPKHIKDAPYDGALSYAYHLDAGKLAQFLKERFRKKGVHHIIDKVEDVAIKADGCIDKLILASGTEIGADIFIDCTGFAARLINADKTNTFKDKSHILFVDQAVTTRIPHDGLDSINGYTKSTAQNAGWIWDIALRTRRGVGHVYSSKHTDDETARKKLASYLGIDISELETRKLSMRIGYHHQQWRGNCISIGLSSGFLEPLESTGIYLIEMANWALLDLLPRYLSGTQPQKHYNEIMTRHYENIVDFLKLHYCLSERRDTPFWTENCDPDTIPASLMAKLDLWKNDIPSIYDFERTTQCFSATNYQFILFGMGWKSHLAPTDPDPQSAKMMAELAIRRDRLKQFIMRDTVTNAELFKAL